MDSHQGLERYLIYAQSPLLTHEAKQGLKRPSDLHNFRLISQDGIAQIFGVNDLNQEVIGYFLHHVNLNVIRSLYELNSSVLKTRERIFRKAAKVQEYVDCESIYVSKDNFEAIESTIRALNCRNEKRRAMTALRNLKCLTALTPIRSFSPFPRLSSNIVALHDYLKACERWIQTEEFDLNSRAKAKPSQQRRGHKQLYFRELYKAYLIVKNRIISKEKALNPSIGYEDIEPLKTLHDEIANSLSDVDFGLQDYSPHKLWRLNAVTRSDCYDKIRKRFKTGL